jgi:hypothetical protein
MKTYLFTHYRHNTPRKTGGTHMGERSFEALDRIRAIKIAEGMLRHELEFNPDTDFAYLRDGGKTGQIIWTKGERISGLM